MKTVRFSEVVAKCGKPEPYTLWTDPKKDADFQRALKQGRIMTVHQETVGKKADYGSIGFTNDRRAQLLLFPKSLEQFEGRRVLAVKYQLLDQPAAEAPSAAADREAKKPARAKAPARPPKPTPAAGKKILQFKAAEEPKAAAARPAAKLSVDQFRTRLRRAIKALEAGKAVQAHQILQEIDRETFA